MIAIVTLFSLTSSCSKDDSKTSPSGTGTATLKVNTNIIHYAGSPRLSLLGYYQVQLINNGQIKTTAWSDKEQDVLTFSNVAYGDYTAKIIVSKTLTIDKPYSQTRQETSNTVNFKVNDANVTIDIEG
ncbi:MAG: hypothetical protein WCK82_09390 [Bacteroidota bacterium]